MTLRISMAIHPAQSPAVRLVSSSLLIPGYLAGHRKLAENWTSSCVINKLMAMQKGAKKALFYEREG